MWNSENARPGLLQRHDLRRVTDAVDGVVPVGLHPRDRQLGQRARSVLLAQFVSQRGEVLADRRKPAGFRLLTDDIGERQVRKAPRA